MAYTNDDLLEIIKFKGSVPENNDQFSDQKLLNLATEVLLDTLLPVILRLREEYYVFPLTQAITANTAKYRVSPRFVGAMLRDVQLVDGSQLKSLPQIPVEEVNTTEAGNPSSFYMQGASLVLYPTPNANTSLQLTGYLKPSRLTEVTNCGKIATINTGTNQVTVDSLPTSFTTGAVVDFVKGSAGNEILDIEYTISNASGVTITFSSLPTGLAVGDYVTPFGFTPVPNIPEEFFSVLAEYAVQKVLKSMAYNDEASVAGESASNLMQNILQMMKPRVSGAPKKFKTRLL